jgi:phytoene dehydrogenase-like protein
MTGLRDLTAGRTYDAVVVGAGPNGLAAALTLARAGRSVLVVEAAATVGGGARTAELTLPGFRHDVCSAIHPLGLGSPFFRTVPLADHGVEWIQPPFAAAHPLDDGSAGVLARSLDETARTLGADGEAWRRLFGPLSEAWDRLAPELLGPILHVPRHPLALARFGLRAVWPAATLARNLFRTDRARALFAGLAAHAIMPLERPLTGAFGLVLGMAGHAVGWPLPRGGSQTIADALAALVRAHGGEIVTNAPVASLGELPAARAVLLDVTPRQLLAVAGDRLRGRYRRRLERYRYGPAVFKVDAALDGPIPWRVAECAQAGTVHLGGTLDEVAAAEAAVWRGEHPETRRGRPRGSTRSGRTVTCRTAPPST